MTPKSSRARGGTRTHTLLRGGGFKCGQVRPADSLESVCPAQDRCGRPSDPANRATSARLRQILCRNRAARRGRLSYQPYYHTDMTQRQKRSISLPADLADAIDQAANAEGTTVSAWIADTAAHRLRIDAGRQGVAEWERQHGALTTDELADGLACARAMLRRQPSRKSA